MNEKIIQNISKGFLEKLFVSLSALHVTNLWLLMQILERVSEDKSWIL